MGFLATATLGQRHKEELVELIAKRVARPPDLQRLGDLRPHTDDGTLRQRILRVLFATWRSDLRLGGYARDHSDPEMALCLA